MRATGALNFVTSPRCECLAVIGIFFVVSDVVGGRIVVKVLNAERWHGLWVFTRLTPNRLAASWAGPTLPQNPTGSALPAPVIFAFTLPMVSDASTSDTMISRQS